MAEFGITEDNMAWAKAALEAELPGSPEPYSPMNLPGFNEKKYMNQPTKEDGEEAPEDEGAEHAGEATAKEAGEVAAQDLPSEP